MSREVIFTFHYFSINTGIVLRDFTGRFLSLHSTMFLLIHKRYAGGKPGDQNFTFHYVSINTCLSVLLSQGRSNFTFHYVSINTGLIFAMFFLILTLHSTMFLLIRPTARTHSISNMVFTFHYVSINTLRFSRWISCRSDLYIPLCFY